MTIRYALYLAPPAGSALEDFACRWLGRDHRTGAAVEQLDLPGLSPERHAEITASPRHYGFHGTLKAPFALKLGRSEAELMQAAADFAQEQKPFTIERLQVQSLSGFLALVPAEPCQPLNQLAADGVIALDPYRAPLSQADIERRRQSKLTPRQDAQMLQWGYPYIFEDFRFHMTLTQKLPGADQQELLPKLQGYMRDILGSPLKVEGVAIYAQQDRDNPFTLKKRLAFAAS